MPSKKKALIVGGGIGGLSAAIAMKRVGWDICVFEQAPELTEVGVAVQTFPNCSNAMDKLGILDDYAAMSAEITDMGIFSTGGRLLLDLDFPRGIRRTGYRSYSAHRYELIEMLGGLLSPSDLSLSSVAHSYRVEGDRAVLELADGREFQGDVLIAADGINSRIRSVLNRRIGHEQEPRYSGYIAWRGTTPAFLEQTTVGGFAGLAMGRGAQVGYFPMTQERIYWFTTKNTPPEGRQSSESSKTEVMSIVENWADPFPYLIDSTPAETIIRSDISDYLPTTSVWGEHCVTLLGDAAHATTPNIGQGACMAVEDAVSLAAYLKDASDIPAALRAYERDRTVRTKPIVEQSQRIGEMIQIENPLLTALRDTILRFTPSRFISSQQIEIFSHDSPSLA